jgi:cysteine desulfurase/selenocysteine lyase
MQEVLENRRGVGDRAAPHTHTSPITVASGNRVPDASEATADLTTCRVDTDAIRRDFPILSEPVHGHPLVWLDNAATTQKPRSVIDRIVRFYEHENANVHRAGHALGARATDAFETARETARHFLNAPDGSVVFVRGTTEGINLVANTWGRRHIGRDDEIVVSDLEHHSNLVPWQMLAAERGARLRAVPIDARGQLSVDAFEQTLSPRTRLVALTHMSNALGTVTPIKELIRIAHARGACVVVDGAQAISHVPVDVQDLGADFYAFSGHKALGPTGIGVLYGTPQRLDESPAWQGGGSMVTDVSLSRSLYHAGASRFEAGTPNIAGAVGLGAALDYLASIGMARVEAHDRALTAYAASALANVRGLRLVGTAENKLSVVSFVIDGIDSADVGSALDGEGIAVRVGHHCALPTLRSLGFDSVVRPSLSVYNNRADIDALVASLQQLVAARRGRVEA